jgi:dTDP-4-amino-4,6-dideoxygalactose transaminase
VSDVQIPSQQIVFSDAERAEVLRRIDAALRDGQISQGRNVREFEEEFAGLVGAAYAIAVNGGGSALQIALQLLGATGRDVLVPTNTFAATAAEVLLAGGRVRLADVDASTFGVNVETLAAARTPETAGVIVVHVGGLISPKIDEIRRWCDREGLWLLEDASHAQGCSLGGRQAGRFGDLAAFSLFATKVLTCGEGGVLVTDDPERLARAQRLRDYGKPSPWISLSVEVATNRRMSEFAAALGVVHLAGLAARSAERQRVADAYSALLADLPVVTPVLPVNESTWYKYILLLPPDVDREFVKQGMRQRGVALAGGVFETPLHRQPIFDGYPGAFPVADDICARHICLPLYPGLSHDQAQHVVTALAAALADPAVRR